jgi:hypothetical protein
MENPNFNPSNNLFGSDCKTTVDSVKSTASKILTTKSCMSKSILETGKSNNSQTLIYSTKLTIVDLAGAERNKRTKNDAVRLKESNFVNLSLSALRKCFLALKKKKRVPFRESKLTHFLKEYFKDDKSISIIININPCQADFEETLQVLEYANVAKKIELIKSTMKSRMSLPLAYKNKNKIRPPSKALDKSILLSVEKNKKSKLKNHKNPSLLTNIENEDMRKMIREEIKKECEAAIKKQVQAALKNYSEIMDKKIEALNKAIISTSSQENPKIKDLKQINKFKEIFAETKSYCLECEKNTNQNKSQNSRQSQSQIGIKRKYSRRSKIIQPQSMCRSKRWETFFEDLEQRITLKAEQNEVEIKKNKKNIKKNTKDIKKIKVGI